MLYVVVALYILLLVSVSIAARRLISSDKDYLLAGRSLPLSLSTFALFATWFGSETIVGATEEFVKSGFIGVIEEPFGAGLCLILAGLFFVRPLYRMSILTLADFFRVRYGDLAEILSSIFLTLSYFGWVAAQFVAFAVVLHTLTGLDVSVGIVLGLLVSVGMVYSGGMWAIAITDFIQTLIIVGSLVIIFGFVIYVSGGFENIVNNVPDAYFKILPEPSVGQVVDYLVAWMVIGLGSIPGQELFQRFMSSKSERVAVYSSLIAGFMYLSVAMLPLFIALYAKFSLGIDENPLLNYINTLNPVLKVMFFLGLLSAILSTACAAILAPSAIISENILTKIFKNMSEASKLILNRLSTVFVGFVSLLFAFSGESVYELVAYSSVVTLVSLFAPLTFGLYLKQPSRQGAILSMVSGFSVWFFVDVLFSYKAVGILAGFLTSVFVMAFFNFRWILRR